MPGGHFHMGRKSKYSADFKLMIIHEAETSGITKTSRKYSLSDHTIRTWKLIYKYQGIHGSEPTHSNNTYSKEYKTSLVEEYQKSDEKLEEFAIRHGLRGRTQLSQWIMGYNESILEDHRSGKRDSGMKGRKTTFDERLEIIEQLIRHDVDYKWAAEHYNVSYSQVYGWYRKYTGSGNNPESLRDCSGKAKPESEFTEMDRLKRENKLLKARLHQQEIEIDFAKKISRNKQQRCEKGIRQKTITELNEEYGWSISELCRTAGITRDAHYKWLKRGTSKHQSEKH